MVVNYQDLEKSFQGWRYKACWHAATLTCLFYPPLIRPRLARTAARRRHSRPARPGLAMHEPGLLSGKRSEPAPYLSVHSPRIHCHQAWTAVRVAQDSSSVAELERVDVRLTNFTPITPLRRLKANYIGG